MKENADKSLDDLARKVMGTSNLERPSFDFTQQVMSHIQALNTSKAFVYQPLISKWVWAILGGLLVFVFGYVWKSSSEGTMEPSHNLRVDYDIIERVSALFSQFQVSHITIYAVLLFCGMLYIQIPLLKVYRHKQDTKS